MRDQGMARTGRWNNPRPLPVQPAPDNGINLLGSLGSGIASVVSQVEQHISHVTNLLPIVEENGQDDARPPNAPPQAAAAAGARSARAGGPRRNLLSAPNSGVAFTLDAGGAASPTVLSTASWRSQGTQQSSRASVAQTTVPVARFGSMAESYQVRVEDGSAKLRNSGRSTSLPAGMTAACAENLMYKNLPAVADGSMKFPRKKDSCDKATRSKIDRWMQKASPPPEDEPTNTATEAGAAEEEGENPLTILQFPRFF
jgi:hypothetical protein